MSKTVLNNGTTKSTNKDLIYQLEGKPPLTVAIPIGLQHVLAMFAGNLAPVLILIGLFKDTLNPSQQNSIIQCAMFVSGATTFIQLYPIKLFKGYRIGAGLPIVMGTSFAFVPTIQTLAKSGYELEAILGAAIFASFVEVFMGFFYKPLQKLFPPLVVGSVLVTIGVKLLTVGVNYFAGGGTPEFNPNYGSIPNLILGFTTFTVIIVLQRFGKGMWKLSSILLGLFAGYILAIVMGLVNFDPVVNASMFAVPLPHIALTDLQFQLDPIVAFSSIFIVSGLETIGNVNGITIAGLDREANAEEVSGGILADAVGSTFACLFNALPNTAFGQNAGIISMTKVINKWCVAMGAFILVGASFFPKIGAIFNAMPSSVLGGAVITVFAMILINGIKMISMSGFSERNVLVLGITFGIGMGLGGVHEATQNLPPYLAFIFKDTVACVCIISIIANLIFKEKEAK